MASVLEKKEGARIFRRADLRGYLVQTQRCVALQNPEDFSVERIDPGRQFLLSYQCRKILPGGLNKANYVPC